MDNGKYGKTLPYYIVKKPTNEEVPFEPAISTQPLQATTAVNSITGVKRNVFTGGARPVTTDT